jgi:Tfp pilus assembly protein PilF
MPQRAREFMVSGEKKLYQDKNARAALSDFQKAVKAAPGHYEAQYQMAITFLILGEKQRADSSFRKAIELSGDHYGEADVGLGTMMLDRGEFQRRRKDNSPLP